VYPVFNSQTWHPIEFTAVMGDQRQSIRKRDRRYQHVIGSNDLAISFEMITVS